MKLLEKIIKRESGQALAIVLVLLAVGGLLIMPTLGLGFTTLKGHQAVEPKVYELYAAAAGIEDAMHKIVTNDAWLRNWDEGQSDWYDLPHQVNGMPVKVTVTKLALVHGILGEDEYKLGQPHVGWLQPEMPYEAARTDEYVEYQCNITIVYDGVGSRQISGIGAFFSPLPGDENLIVCPYDVTTSGVITFDHLATDSPEVKSTAGGWAVIWRWEQNQGPIFDTTNNEGGLSFKFRIMDPGWELGLYFTFLTTKEQDISYSASGEFCKWVIEAKAEDTIVKSCVLQEINDGLNVLTWEINPPA